MGPIFKDESYLNLEDGTDRMYPKGWYGIRLTVLRCIKTQNEADLMYIAVETWNHLFCHIRVSKNPAYAKKMKYTLCASAIFGSKVIQLETRQVSQQCGYELADSS